MTREEAIKELTELLPEEFLSEYTDAIKMAIEALEQEHCDDCIRRSDIGLTDFEIVMCNGDYKEGLKMLLDKIEKAPSVSPQPKMGRCKDCKYFEYDSVAEVHGIPLIVAHEICKRWGKGCQTREDGYCFLFEPQEGSDKE